MYVSSSSHERANVGGALAHAGPARSARLPRRPREREVHVDEVLRRFMQRPEVGQLLLACAPRRRASASPSPAFERCATPAPYSVIARIGAEPVPVQIMRRFEPGWFGIRNVRAERARAPDLVALLQVAQVIGATPPRPASPVAVAGHALHRERDVVVAGALAVARARDGVRRAWCARPPARRPAAGRRSIAPRAPETRIVRRSRGRCDGRRRRSPRRSAGSCRRRSPSAGAVACTG